MGNKFYSNGLLTVSCTECGHQEHIRCDAETADAIINRKGLIQNLLPDESPDVREMFLSGWCGCCYDLNLMYFPQEALDELTEIARKEFRNEKIYGFESSMDVKAFLAEVESLVYDDLDGFNMTEQELESAIAVFRTAVHDIAERIEDGEFEEE